METAPADVFPPIIFAAQTIHLSPPPKSFIYQVNVYEKTCKQPSDLVASMKMH